MGREESKGGCREEPYRGVGRNLLWAGRNVGEG